MKTRTALSLMLPLVVACCASCAPRATEPTVPEVPVAPEEVQARTAEAAILLTDTVSTVLDNVEVAHRVPDGWTLDLEDASRGHIRMHSPDEDATIGLAVTIAGGSSPTERMMIMYSNWQREAAQDANIRVARPDRHETEYGEIWGLMVRVLIGDGAVTIAHLFFATNEPGYIVMALGTWPSERDDYYLPILGRLAGSAYILPCRD